MNDASIYWTIFTCPGQFTLGYPIAAYHIEDYNTQYSDYVEIWTVPDLSSYHMQLMKTDGSGYSKNQRCLVWYVTSTHQGA